MKKITTLLLALFVLVSATLSVTASTPPQPKRFIDVSREDWFYSSVYAVYEAGIMEGISAHDFAPDKFMTRAEFVTAFYRMKGSPAVKADAPFKDLTAEWYVNGVNWAYDMGIVKGKDEATFDPDGMITRQEIFTILDRSAVFVGYDSGLRYELSMFADHEEVADWGWWGCYWAVSNNIITGIKQMYNGSYETCLVPEKNLTRAEAATVLVRYLENAFETESECTVTVNGIMLDGKYPLITAPNHETPLIPLVAMLEALGADVKWVNDHFAEIKVGDLEYILNVEHNYLQYKTFHNEDAPDYERTILNGVGGRTKKIYRSLEKELLVDRYSLSGVCIDLGLVIKVVDKTVYIDYRNS